MNPTRQLALSVLLPLPAALAMWFYALLPGISGVTDLVSVVIVVVTAVVSVAVISKVSAAEYDLRGKTSGVLFAVAGLILYFEGTTIQSSVLHLLSTALFYWGCVLYLAGVKPMASTVPAGLVALLAALPLGGALNGLAADGAAIALSVASVVLIWFKGAGIQEAGCGYCSSFRESGDAFCAFCGRMVGRAGSRLPRKRFAGFVVFSLLVLSSFAVALPVLVSAPSVSFVNFGLGGPQGGNTFVPLPNWKVSGSSSLANGTVESYALAQGRSSLQALTTVATSSNGATSALDTLRGNTTSGPPLPKSIASVMTSYTLTSNGNTSVGVEGVFRVGLFNGSSILNEFVAFDLRQAASSFKADNGSTIFGAAAGVAGWAGTSGAWSPTVGRLLPVYQLFYQLLYLVSIAVVVAVAFTLSRDQELARSRRHEAMEGLSQSELDVLGALGARGMTGEEVGASAKSSDTVLFSSLKELARRDLVGPAVALRRGKPTMLWESRLL